MLVLNPVSKLWLTAFPNRFKCGKLGLLDWINGGLLDRINGGLLDWMTGGLLGGSIPGLLDPTMNWLLGISIPLSNTVSCWRPSFLCSAVYACRNASASSIILSDFWHTSQRSSPSSHRARSVRPSIS